MLKFICFQESSNIPKSGTSKKVTTDLAKVKKQVKFYHLMVLLFVYI